MAETDRSAHLLLTCWSCPQTFFTANERSTHHLDAHERPLPVPHRDGWQAAGILAGFTPPNWKAQSAQEWQTNGAHA